MRRASSSRRPGPAAPSLAPTNSKLRSFGGVLVSGGPDCPKCHGSDRIESVEETTIQYPVRIQEDGSFDYSGDESRTFDEGASNIGKGDNFTLYCRDCGTEYTVTLQREEQ